MRVKQELQEKAARGETTKNKREKMIPNIHLHSLTESPPQKAVRERASETCSQTLSVSQTFLVFLQDPLIVFIPISMHLK